MMINKRTIVEQTLVPHPAFENALQRLEQCFDYASEESESICIALVGESRTGKSRVLEECFNQHPKTRDSEGLNTPILRVKTPSKPTVKSLAELMLWAMGDILFDKGTENRKTLRLQTLMRQSGTRMVMIDEFQHFVDKGSHKVMHHVADWLKALVDDSRLALVVAGLPTCQAVLEQNEQLAGRFLSPVFMPRFDWQKDEQRDEFRGILGSFHESISLYFDLPKLDGDEMAFRCYCATGGLMGYLSKFLRQMVWNALDSKMKSISLADLERAHNESVWAKEGPLGIPSPFMREFIPPPTDELLAKIRNLGTPKDAPQISRQKQFRRQEILTVRDVLTAK